MIEKWLLFILKKKKHSNVQFSVIFDRANRERDHLNKVDPDPILQLGLVFDEVNMLAKIRDFHVSS